jgi:hypothetical protein
MPSLIVAPQSAGLSPVSYLTTSEYRDAPTDVDLASLVPGGNPQQQDNQLATIIAQASAWMDGYCHYQLGATIDTETVRARVRADGYVCVPVRGVPVLEVVSFAIGAFPSQMQALASAADGFIQDNTIWMPALFGATGTTRTLGPGLGDRVWCKWVYVNGYANTLTTAVAHAADTSIEVDSPLGIYPGTSLVISDSGRSETVAVASSYVSSTTGGPVTIPLVAPLLNDHTAVDLSVSALPANVKKAAILATTAFIKVRGGGGLVLEDIRSGTPKEATGEQGGLEDLALAEMLLQRYVLPYFG